MVEDGVDVVTDETVLVLQLMAMIVFGIIGSSRMKSMGHSGAAGFGLGATLGVIGLFIVWRITKAPGPEVRDLAPGWMSRGTEDA